MLPSGTLRDLKYALGDEAVIIDQQALAAAERTTFATYQRIPVILRPADRAGVSAALRIANSQGLSVYPISSGKNWGYGSRVPVTDGCALLDLGRLNKILDLDKKQGYVTIEAGVTQRMLYEFLQAQQSGLWMDATGSSPECSVIGNSVERGFGHTPYSDHFANMCGLEVVLASGEVIETGFAGMPRARTASTYRWGLGPSLDGLFSQSNFGVVTRATVWLMPAPEYSQAYFFQCGSAEALAPVIDALQPLRLNGTLCSAIHVGNDYKVLGGLQQYPEGEGYPLSRERMAHYRKELKIAKWSGSGALYGTKAQVAEARRLVKVALRGKVDQLRFLDDRLLRLASRFHGIYRTFTGLDIAKTLEVLVPVYGLLKGVPTMGPMSSSYWRMKMPVPADPDPDRDGCGLLWCSPLAPLDGRAATEMVDLTENILLAHGFEPMISLTLLTQRTVAGVISITYDRRVPGEDERAMKCYDELKDSLVAAGFYSYRLGISSMGLQATRESYSELLTTLKDALDPNGVLAPGRYVPASKNNVLQVTR